MLHKSDMISAIHHSGRQAVIAVSGGGSLAISDLLTVPGASAFLLEASVPYASNALTQWLGRKPENFCARETALAMAAVAFQKGRQLGGDADKLVGVGCTASLVSNLPKLGEHRVWITTQTVNRTEVLEYQFAKGLRDRLQEERLVADLLLEEIASACGVTQYQSTNPKRERGRALPEPQNVRTAEDAEGYEASALADAAGDISIAVDGISRTTDQLHRESATAEPALAMLWNGVRSWFWSLPMSDDPATSWSKFDAAPAMSNARGLLSGAFNPLHDGHRELACVADRQINGPVAVEMSIVNVDKPPLDYLTIAARRRQFIDRPLVLTRAPTFVEKSRLFPNTTFIVGIDTAERIVQSKYYHGSEADMLSALEEIRTNGCRFLVAGRIADGRFQTLSETAFPSSVRDLFEEIPEREFRRDITSTELRRTPAT